MARRTWVVLLALTALGLAASGMSTYVHHRLVFEPGYTSFCDVGATVSCTQVYQSAYGSLYGIPVALLGFLWFVAIGALLLGVGRGSRSNQNVPAYLFVLSTAGLAVVLYLGYASFFVLKTVCVLCVTTYAAVVGIFVISGSATSIPMTSVPKRAVSDLRLLMTSPKGLVISVLLVVGTVFALAEFPREQASATAAGAEKGQQAVAPAPAPDQGRLAEFGKWFTSQPRRDLPVPAEGAALVIVKFNDYQCPPCRQTYLDYKGIIAQYQSRFPGKVTFVTKDYPLDPECNAQAQRGAHVAGCEAAVAVRLARRNGRAAQLEDWLFANQPSLTPEVVKTAAREVGGVTDFEAQYASQIEGVKADIAMGNLLGVQATPTFFINGVMIRGGLQPQFFQAALEYELSRAAK